MPLAASAQLATLDEAKEYLLSVTLEQAAADILKLDQIEHGTPVVEWPAVLAVLDDRATLHLAYQGPAQVNIAGHLRYSLTIADVRIEGFTAPPSWLKLGGVGLGGLSLGLGAGIVGDSAGGGLVLIAAGGALVALSVLIL